MTDFFSLRPRPRVVYLSPPPAEQSFLTPAEFDSLIGSLQLLRISQLRYIVQRFAIPATGNKTKLLGLVVSILETMRLDPVLKGIRAEVNRLLAEHTGPFSDPFATFDHLQPVAPDATFQSLPNPLILQSDHRFLFGPFLAPPGQFTGKFTFTCPPTDNPVNIAFLFPESGVHPFAFRADLNGFLFELSLEDPFPSNLDITQVLNSGPTQNVLDIQFLLCRAPMMICICEYQYVGVLPLAEKICGRTVRVNETIFVRAKGCAVHRPLELIGLLSRFLATGIWRCPVCHRDVEMGDIEGLAPDEANSVPVGIFHPGARELLDWDDF
jgi:hypothetical protein